MSLSIVLFVPRAAKLNVNELVIDDAGVVRARRLADRDNAGFLIYDLEGELFFGVGPELERTFAHIGLQAKLKGVDKVLLRLKRVRNPDVVSLEHLEHFLKDARANGLEVWLAGLRPDLDAAIRRLGFLAWFPEERLLPHGTEDYSATLTAIARIQKAVRTGDEAVAGKNYYLV